MKLLAIETSTDACSVAVSVDGSISEDHRVLPRGHHKALLPMIEGLLARAHLPARALQGIVLSAGPGSFTGLRIGAGVAQALAFAADCPLLALSSLRVLAAGAKPHAEESIVATQAARPGEVYVGIYLMRDGLPVESVSDRVVPLAQAARVLADVRDAVIVGRSATELAAACSKSWRDAGEALPRASSALALGSPLIEAGEGSDPARLELNYVSDTSNWRKA
jgi:tRNA threonylcarbamoyladenosine biosynthesis protein TsaB